MDDCANVGNSTWATTAGTHSTDLPSTEAGAVEAGLGLLEERAREQDVGSENEPEHRERGQCSANVRIERVDVDRAGFARREHSDDRDDAAREDEPGDQAGRPESDGQDDDGEAELRDGLGHRVDRHPGEPMEPLEAPCRNRVERRRHHVHAEQDERQ